MYLIRVQSNKEKNYVNNMTNTLALRLHDLDSTTRQKLSNLLASIDGSYCIAYETHDCIRPHFQGWIRCREDIQAIRERIYKHIPDVKGRGRGRGNSAYSLEVVKDFDRYQYYILKGSPEQLPTIAFRCSYDVTDEQINTMHEEYWKRQTIQNTKNRKGLTTRILEWTQNQSFENMHEAMVEDIVSEHIINEYISAGKLMMHHQMSGLFNLIMCMVSTSYKRSFQMRLLGRN